MNRFSMTSIAMMMSFRVTEREVQKIVDKLDIVPAESPGIVEPEIGTVALVQLLLRRYKSLGEYIVDMNLYVADAVNRKADLILFPALTGMLPLSLIPQSGDLLNSLQVDPETRLPNPGQLAECLSLYSDAMFDAYYYTMSALAARHRVWIAAGSVLYFDHNELCHRALLFNDRGELAGTQDKIAQSPLETALRIDPAGEVRVFATPAGPMSILIGSDADYFEPGRIAASLGARILLNPTGFLDEYTPMDTAGGLQLRVQENLVYGAQATSVGDLGIGLTMEGPCSAFAPIGVAHRRNGVLGQSSGRQEPDILAARFDFPTLEEHPSPWFRDRNPGLMEKYLDRLY